MGWGSVAMGGLGLIGSHLTNQANKRMAQKQMDFQRDMSNTAHQREVEDLRKAGLNPILSAGGSGASTPSGATAQMENVIGQGVSSAMEYKRLKKDLKEADSRVNLNTLQGQLAEQQKAFSETQAKKTTAETEHYKATLPAVKEEARVREKYAETKAISDVAGKIIGAATGATAVGLGARGLGKFLGKKGNYPDRRGSKRDRRKNRNYHKVDKETGEILP